jgi:hypothetical protein
MKRVLFLGALLLMSITSFSQAKFVAVHNSGRSNGAEITYCLKDTIGNLHRFDLGGGATFAEGNAAGRNFNSAYAILGNQVAKYFTVGAKAGGYIPNPAHNSNIYLYYGAVSYLQFSGKNEGFILGLGFDNLRYTTVGLGYKFK